MENPEPAKRKTRLWIWIIAALFGIPFLGGALSSVFKQSIPAPPIEFPLEKISGKTQSEAEKIIGKGTLVDHWTDKTSGCNKCPKYTYRSGKIEIIYINDVADRITVNNLEKYDFNDDTILGLLGIEVTPSPDRNDSVRRWHDYNGHREIMAFNADGKIDYILVKSKAE